jgi:hypothetical protein
MWRNARSNKISVQHHLATINGRLCSPRRFVFIVSESSVHVHKCHTELPILEAVIKCVINYFTDHLREVNAEDASIRNRLTVLKRDRGEYIKPSDVNSLYQAVVKQGACRRRWFQPGSLIVR